MTAKKLGCVIVDDCFGALTEFCSRRAWPELALKHNDETNDYHLSLYKEVVIGFELIACWDIVGINLSSVWMLANVLSLLLDGIFSSMEMSLEIFAAGASISSSCQLHPYHATTMSFACPLFRRRWKAIKFIL
jgi:hypothetical protein